MTREQAESIENEIAQLTYDCNRIEYQLMEADTLKHKRSEEWHIKALYAKKKKNRKINYLQKQVADWKKEEELKEKRSFAQLFVSFSKKMLTPEQYEEIESTVNEHKDYYNE